MTVNKDMRIKTWEVKEHFADNHVHNIFRLFDGWGNFLLTKSETKRAPPPPPPPPPPPNDLRLTISGN